MSFSFLVDTTPPTIANLLPAPATWVTSPTAQISADLSDAGSGISPLLSRLWLDGEDVSTSSERSAGRIVFRPAHLAEGPHTAHVATWDQAGNLTEAESQWNVDSVPPLAELLSPAPGSTTANVRPPVEIELTDPAPGSGVAASSIGLTLDGAPVLGTLFGTMLTYAPAADLASGLHTVGLDQRDVAGNRTTRSWTFTVESAAPPRGPNLTITSPVEGAVVRNWFLTIDLAFSPTNDPIDRSSLRVVLDPLSANPQDLSAYAVDTPTGAHVDPGWSLTLTQGSHDAMASLSDVSGRRTDFYVRFLVDWSGPHLAITSPEDGAVLPARSPVIQIAFSENGVPINRSSLRVWFYPPGVPPMNLTSLATDVEGGVVVDLSRIPALNDGVYYLNVSLGNTSYFYSYAAARFTVDTVAPVLRIDAGPLAVVRSAPAALTVYWQDAGGIAPDTLRAVLDRGTPAERDVTGWMSVFANRATLDLWDANALPEGSHTLDVFVADKAGHGVSASQQFVVDDTGPTVTLLAPEDPTSVTTLLPQIEIVFSDAVAGVQPYGAQLWLNGDQFFNDYFAFQADRVIFPSDRPDRVLDRPLLRYGENHIAVETKDRVGNVTHTEFTITARPKVTLRLNSRQAQMGLINRPAMSDISVTALDAEGAVWGAPLKFDVSGGDGLVVVPPLPNYGTTTGSTGVAAVQYRLPGQPGTSKVTVSLPGAANTAHLELTFTAVLPTVWIAAQGNHTVALTGMWAPGDLANQMAYEVMVRAEDHTAGIGEPVARVEIQIPEDEQRMWVMRWEFGSSYSNPFGVIPREAGPTEVKVRLPEFPRFLYRRAAADGSGQLDPPEVVAEAKFTVTPPPWVVGLNPYYFQDCYVPLAQSIIRGGQGQTVGPDGNWQPVDLDFSEFKEKFDAYASAVNSKYHYDPPLAIAGVLLQAGQYSFYLEPAAKVRIKGLRVPGTGAFGLLLPWSVVLAGFPQDRYPSGPQATDGGRIPEEDGYKVLDLARNWISAHSSYSTADMVMGEYHPVTVACEGPRIAFVRADSGRELPSIPTRTLQDLAAEPSPSPAAFRVRMRTPPGVVSVPGALYSQDPWGRTVEPDNLVPAVAQYLALRPIESPQPKRFALLESDPVLLIDGPRGQATPEMARAEKLQANTGMTRYQEAQDFLGADRQLKSSLLVSVAAMAPDDRWQPRVPPTSAQPAFPEGPDSGKLASITFTANAYPPPYVGPLLPRNIWPSIQWRECIMGSDVSPPKVYFGSPIAGAIRPATKGSEVVVVGNDSVEVYPVRAGFTMLHATYNWPWDPNQPDAEQRLFANSHAQTKISVPQLILVDLTDPALQDIPYWKQPSFEQDFVAKLKKELDKRLRLGGRVNLRYEVLTATTAQKIWQGQMEDFYAGRFFTRIRVLGAKAPNIPLALQKGFDPPNGGLSYGFVKNARGVQADDESLYGILDDINHTCDGRTTYLHLEDEFQRFIEQDPSKIQQNEIAFVLAYNIVGKVRGSETFKSALIYDIIHETGHALGLVPKTPYTFTADFLTGVYGSGTISPPQIQDTDGATGHNKDEVDILHPKKMMSTNWPFTKKLEAGDFDAIQFLPMEKLILETILPVFQR